jgi:WD40 repeat protein
LRYLDNEEDGPARPLGWEGSHGEVGDEEELLQPSRPLLPRRAQIAVLLLAVLAIAVVIAVGVWPRSNHPGPAVPPALPSVPSAAWPLPLETSEAWPPRPSAPAACGTQVVWPIVSSTTVKEPTDIKVLLGGSGLRIVDFDTGHAASLPRSPLRRGEFVVELISESQTYAVTGGCTFKQPRVLRIGAAGRASVITVPGFSTTVFADGPRAWSARLPTDFRPNGFLLPLEGGSRVRLPVWFWPHAITSRVIVGHVGPTATGAGPLLLIDAATGHVRDNLGDGRPVAVGHGVVVWAAGCDASSDRPYMLHRRFVTGVATSSYRLPRPPGVGGGVLSPDGRKVAFTLERARQDPRYEHEDPRYVQGRPAPPSDIVILQLDTGVIEVVPGIETSATSPPGLAFSADGRWLVVALDAGSRTRLLAWHSGLTHPYESKPIAGKALPTPAIAVLPSRTLG